MQVVGNYQQNNQSFKMNLTCKQGSGTRKIIENSFQKIYTDYCQSSRIKHFGEKDFNFKQMYKDLQKTVKYLTKGLGGTVKIIEDKGPKSPLIKDKFLKISYNLQGKTVVSDSSFLPSQLLPNSSFDKGIPYKSPVELIVTYVSDLMAHDGCGYGKNNKAFILSEKLDKLTKND